MMNREIKFRAWLFGKMGEPFNPFDPVFMASDGTFPNETIIMQYTGLKDKNGNEIYEGDIVEWETGPMSGEAVIRFYDGGFRLSGYVTEDNLLNSEYAKKQCKIIGNIYENPELLK